MPEGYRLELRGVAKRFGPVAALEDVEFTLYPGEVHALVGENGAGKSTLMKILAGVYEPDAGEYRYEGRAVRFSGPEEARALGISIVYQEPTLFPDLSVFENLFVGRYPRRGPLGWIDWRLMRRKAREILDALQASVDLDARVGDLGIAHRQLVEIARALTVDVRVLIMDEPTGSLSPQDVEQIFRIVRRLREAGVSIVFISHRIDEVYEIADRITVLRDGRYVATRPAAGLPRDELIRLMVGRPLDQLFPKEHVPPGEVVLEVRGLSRLGEFRDVSFQVRAGEIVGVAGLIGAGRTELARAIFGVTRPEQGQILLDGRPVHFRSPADAIAAGVAYVPEDRHLQGLILPMSIRENMTMATLDRLARRGFVRKPAETDLAAGLIDRLAVRCTGPEQPTLALSGGNQQKVVLGKWLAGRPRVLILDEPTRGVDVGAKAEIYVQMNALARQGLAILMISSDLPEILGMSDRILVMSDGRLVAEFDRAGATQERIMAAALAGNAAARVRPAGSEPGAHVSAGIRA